ncbi:hypothetical protein [Streptomyces coeruleorubidus]|uniref:Uncharacterized protein n=1 Tax=Streptomyces coeruleorubidus TaxID=116188 RepID=A0ABZ0KV92_STRC4|nr:hypothetical protein [Streptomyces coeruleorubidus]WOT40732.1 hypothetical protein R5U08_42380 [Streptomyces coeruleorubidus]
MLETELLGLALAGGNAVIAAAGTDAWNGFRDAIARWFGRGDAQRELAELERLDQTATALQATEPDQMEQVRIRQESSWQTRIEGMLENLDEVERQQAADQLRDLLAQYVPQGGVAAGPGGVAVGGDMAITAEHGSVAGGVVQGDVHVGRPPEPDPPPG